VQTDESGGPENEVFVSGNFLLILVLFVFFEDGGLSSWVKTASFSIPFDSIVAPSTCGLGSDIETDYILLDHCRGVKIPYNPCFFFA
jgi:hypothetical protein